MNSTMGTFELHSEHLWCEAKRVSLTRSAFIAAIGNHPTASTLTHRRLDARANRKRRRVRLRHHLNEVYSVIVPDNEVVVEERNTLLGEKVVADVIPALILQAVLEFKLKNYCANNGEGKWGTVLNHIFSVIETAAYGKFDDGNVDYGHGGLDHEIISVDFVSYRRYRCFEEVAESS